MKVYNDPEFKVVKMTSEDVLTASKLDDLTSGWETGGSTDLGGGTVPFVTL